MIERMLTFQTSTGPVAYDERGEGDPIVLLPSGGHDHHDYDELRSLMPQRFRTISLDWPAHGVSAGDGPGTAMRLADVAEELIEALAPEGAIVAGNSVGGFAAARLAIRRPELVKGLVLIDSGGFQGRGLQVRVFCALMGRRPFLRAIYPRFSAMYMRARTDADRRARASAIATTRRDPGLRAVAELWASFAAPEYDLRGRLEISSPTLLVWGRRDPVIPLKVGRWLEHAIEGSRLVEFDSGHVPHTSDPAGVAAELEAFAELVFVRTGPRGPMDAAKQPQNGPARALA